MWQGRSLQQEAFCRHQMMADIYFHAELVKRDVQLLAHDIDVNGVDITLIADATTVPLQLKSLTFGSRTASWKVRRRMPFPENDSLLSTTILTPDGPATEGYDGALVVQMIAPSTEKRRPIVWYQVATLPLIFL